MSFSVSGTRLLINDPIPAAGTLDWKTTPQGIKIDMISVQPSVRRQRIGSRLLSEFLRRFGNQQVELEVAAKEHLIEWYSKFGFEVRSLSRPVTLEELWEVYESSEGLGFPKRFVTLAAAGGWAPGLDQFLIEVAFATRTYLRMVRPPNHPLC